MTFNFYNILAFLRGMQANIDLFLELFFINNEIIFISIRKCRKVQKWLEQFLGLEVEIRQQSL